MRSFLLSLVNRIVHCLPSTRFFGIKRYLYRLCGAKIGKNVRICSSATIIGDSSLVIADDVWIGHETMIVASAPVIIDAYVNIAPRCYIGTGTHLIDPYGNTIAGKGVSLPIHIKEGAWLCTHSVVLAGVTVGKKSITAAGAVVCKPVPDGEMWGGVPAKRIRVLSIE